MRRRKNKDENRNLQDKRQDYEEDELEEFKRAEREGRERKRGQTSFPENALLTSFPSFLLKFFLCFM